jgi:hypothetical protein
VELPNIKLEIYDLLGTVVPGLLTIALALVCVLGWSTAFNLVGLLSGTILTASLLGAFAVGQIIQEASDRLVKLFRGNRYLKSGRDSFWASGEKALVQQKILHESGLSVDSVDTAYDFCLTCLGSRFPKRDTFIATSDLARSLWLLCLLGLIPVVQSAVISSAPWRHRILACGGQMCLAGICAYLAWARMVRFRYLSDVTVFRVYIAVGQTAVKPAPNTNVTTDHKSVVIVR